MPYPIEWSDERKRRHSKKGTILSLQGCMGEQVHTSGTAMGVPGGSHHSFERKDAKALIFYDTELRR
jgi:hypothetical protein